ncbi:MAG: TolC family protein [Rhizobiales bacterium TMED94]|nr:transporter [Rhodobiaceae bacterium]RPF86162.1 MAG: TolC family protein [Rhizobiales bacterium TMED94]|tara:strand:+ start:557 stop:1903 length:1347 start_codon:yes stop_codon:yes gene_type:complete
MKMIYIISLLLLIVFSKTQGQEKLTKEEALEIALEQNFGIKVSRNVTEIIKNNSGVLNSGYLPTVSILGGSNYTESDAEIAFPGQVDEDGTPIPNRIFEDQESQRFNAGVNLNYTLFDGLGRKFTYKRLKEQYALSELQLRETIEFTILQLYEVYFNIAQLTESKSIFQENLSISKERQKRAEIAFIHGQGNKLAVLNAQVDVTNDSINLIQIKQQLDNSKRDLNLLLNQPISQNFEVDLNVDFVPYIQIESYLENASENNVELLKQKSNTQINSYDIKISQSGYLPTVGLVGSYGWNLNKSPASPFFPGTNNTSYSVGVGASLSWNLFDGGRTLTRVKNAKLTFENQDLLEQESKLSFNRDITNGIQNFKNTKEIFKIQKKQVETATYNFNRSQAQYKLGSITAIEFRQAQINLTNAQNQRTIAKYQAKLAELQLIQITGQLLNVNL